MTPADDIDGPPPFEGWENYEPEDRGERVYDGYGDRRVIPFQREPAPAGGPRVVGAGASEVKPFVLIRASDLEIREPEFLIRDVMETSTLCCLFGDPGSGKSFLALHMACCIATGTPFFDAPVMQGTVIYLAGEGHGGLARRISAWEMETGVTMKGVPMFISAIAPRILDEAHAEAVADAVASVSEEEGNPRLIVVDTLARSFAGGDENSNQDMGRFVATLDEMKNAYPGCTVLIVHHTGHTSKGRARGSMVLLGAMDAEYMCVKSDDLVAVSNTKMKDAPKFPDKGFELKGVVLGKDSDGREFGSAVLVPTAAEFMKKGKLPDGMRLGLESYLEAKRDFEHCNDPAVGLSPDEWRSHFYAGHTSETSDGKKKAFQRARKDLVDAKILHVTDDLYRIGNLPANYMSAFLKNRPRTGTLGHAGTLAGHIPGAFPFRGGTTGTPPFRGVPVSRQDEVPDGAAEDDF